MRREATKSRRPDCAGNFRRADCEEIGVNIKIRTEQE